MPAAADVNTGIVSEFDHPLKERRFAFATFGFIASVDDKAVGICEVRFETIPPSLPSACTGVGFVVACVCEGADLMSRMVSDLEIFRDFSVLKSPGDGSPR